MSHTQAKQHPYFAMTKKGQGKEFDSEAHLQKQICHYIKLQYPGVLFISTLNGEKLGPGQAVAVANLQSDRGIPDLLILRGCGSYCGLAIELKKEGEKIKKRNGEYVNEHVKEQAQYLQKLSTEGWLACFAVGFEECKSIIDNYLTI